MSLRRRLIISNAAIVLIPILITIAASFSFIFISSKVFNRDISFENFKKLSRINYEFLKVDGSLLKDVPDDNQEKEFGQYLYTKLAEIKAEVLVLKYGETVFSTKKLNKIDIEKSLQLEKGLSKALEIDGASYIVKVFPVFLKDGTEGRTILLAPVGKAGINPKEILLFSIIVYIVSFLITNAALSLILSRSILKPVERLKTAAGEISCGNLEQEVIEDGDDEIKELCRSFERMRLKLKESIYLQMKYDDNRKMLISSISHDLKTPMTSIKGYVEGIIDGVADTPEKTEKYLKTVLSKTVHVDAMIDDLLLYSKLDLNQIPFNFETTDIVKYFEDCVFENGPELEKGNVKLRLQNDLKDSRNLMIDRERMRRVINNIIGNSKKYMGKENGEITIILRETRNSVIIEVQDNGSGIPKEDLPNIFDRFYRSDVSRSQVDGSGLGLAIAKQIIEGHEGRIWAVSRESEGTSVMISLKK